jgi:hypothetical protein
VSRRLDEEIAAAERDARAGRAAPGTLVKLAQLYLRAGRTAQARDTLVEARGLSSPVALDQEGTVELAELWAEIDDLLQRVEQELQKDARDARRAALVVQLSTLTRAEHDELIRLEVQDGLTPHAEPPACPACRGPLRDDPDGPPTGSGVRCARSGKDGDLCRHVDARDLYRCGCCGLVQRAWSRETQGRFRPDPAEPPLGELARSRCPHCAGPVADWNQHAYRCPKAKAAEFPKCPVCDKRGHHARALTCPRCKAEVTSVPCLEGTKRPRPR